MSVEGYTPEGLSIDGPLSIQIPHAHSKTVKEELEQRLKAAQDESRYYALKHEDAGCKIRSLTAELRKLETLNKEKSK